MHVSREVSFEVGLHWPSQTACNGSDADEQNRQSSRLEITSIDLPPMCKTYGVCMRKYWFLHLKQRQPAPWCHFNTLSWPGAALRLQRAASNSLCQQESGGCNQLPPLRLFQQSRGNQEPWEWCSVPWPNDFYGFVFIVFQHFGGNVHLSLFCEDTSGWQPNLGYAVLLLNLFVKVYPGKWVIIPNYLFSSREFFHSTKTGPV